MHERLLSTLVAFIAPDDEIQLSGQPTTPATANAKVAQLTVMEILSYTPRWVFGLFFVLCALGLMQTRTRRVRFEPRLAVAHWHAHVVPVGSFSSTPGIGSPQLGVGSWGLSPSA